VLSRNAGRAYRVDNAQNEMRDHLSSIGGRLMRVFHEEFDEIDDAPPFDFFFNVANANSDRPPQPFPSLFNVNRNRNRNRNRNQNRDAPSQSGERRNQNDNGDADGEDEDEDDDIEILPPLDRDENDEDIEDDDDDDDVSQIFRVSAAMRNVMNTGLFEFVAHIMQQSELGEMDMANLMMDPAQRMAIIHSLPERALSMNEGTVLAKNCLICLQQYVVGEMVRTLPCLHAFHTDCVDAWFRTKLNCPTCRTSIQQADAHAHFDDEEDPEE